jgi:drug/metabolite transporter (DMT)-like permease
MAVLGGLAFAGETSFSKLIPEKFSTIQTSVISWIFGVIVCLPISIILGEKQVIPNFSFSWLIICVYAFVGLLAYYFVLEGYKKIDTSIGGLISTSEIVFGLLFGMLLLNEQISFNVIIGGVLIFVAVLLPNLEMFQKKL